MVDPTIIEDGGIISEAKYRGLIDKWVGYNRHGPGDFTYDIHIREDYDLEAQLFKNFTNWCEKKLDGKWYSYMGNHIHFNFKDIFIDYIMQDDVYDRLKEWILVVDISGSPKNIEPDDIKQGDYYGKLSDIGVVDRDGNIDWPRLRGFIVSVSEKHGIDSNNILESIDDAAIEEVGGPWTKFKMMIGQDQYKESIQTLIDTNEKFKNIVNE